MKLTKLEIKLSDGYIPFTVTIERSVDKEFNEKDAVMEFIECYHPNCIYMGYKEVK